MENGKCAIFKALAKAFKTVLIFRGRAVGCCEIELNYFKTTESLSG